MLLILLILIIIIFLIFAKNGTYELFSNNRNPGWKKAIKLLNSSNNKWWTLHVTSPTCTFVRYLNFSDITNIPNEYGHIKIIMIDPASVQNLIKYDHNNPSYLTKWNKHPFDPSALILNMIPGPDTIQLRYINDTTFDAIYTTQIPDSMAGATFDLFGTLSLKNYY